jgi:hypothetical protein
MRRRRLRRKLLWASLVLGLLLLVLVAMLANALLTTVHAVGRLPRRLADAVTH